MNNKKTVSHTAFMKKHFLLLSVLLVLCIACFAGCMNNKPVAKSSQTEMTAPEDTDEHGMPNARRENKRKKPCSDGDCEDGYFDINSDDFGCKIIFNISIFN